MGIVDSKIPLSGPREMELYSVGNGQSNSIREDQKDTI